MSVAAARRFTKTGSCQLGVVIQELVGEIANYRRDADNCKKLSRDASGVECKRLLQEVAALLATLADELEAQLEQDPLVSFHR